MKDLATRESSTIRIAEGGQRGDRMGRVPAKRKTLRGIREQVKEMRKEVDKGFRMSAVVSEVCVDEDFDEEVLTFFITFVRRKDQRSKGETNDNKDSRPNLVEES